MGYEGLYWTSIKNGEKNSEKYLHVYLPNSLGGKILRKEGDSMKDWLHSPPKDDSSLCLGLGWRERGDDRTSGEVTVADDVEVAVAD